jgi:hypothetical protein
MMWDHVAKRRIHRSAIVACFVLWREISRCAFWNNPHIAAPDVCDGTSAVGESRQRIPRLSVLRAPISNRDPQFPMVSQLSPTLRLAPVLRLIALLFEELAHRRRPLVDVIVQPLFKLFSDFGRDVRREGRKIAHLCSRGGIQLLTSISLVSTCRRSWSPTAIRPI